MKEYRIAVIPGDGIGPEVVNATVRILEATGVKFEWESYAAGAVAFFEKPVRPDALLPAIRLALKEGPEE